MWGEGSEHFEKLGTIEDLDNSLVDQLSPCAVPLKKSTVVKWVPTFPFNTTGKSVVWMNESVISELWSIFFKGESAVFLFFLSFFLCRGGIQVCELDKCTVELLINTQRGRRSIDWCRNFIESYPHPPIRPFRLEHRVVSLCSNLLVVNFAGEKFCSEQSAMDWRQLRRFPPGRQKFPWSLRVHTSILLCRHTCHLDRISILRSVSFKKEKRLDYIVYRPTASREAKKKVD